MKKNLLETILTAAGILLALTGLVLRFTHSMDYPSGLSLMMYGFLLGLLAQSRYAHRLQARVQELEAQLPAQ